MFALFCYSSSLVLEAYVFFSGIFPTAYLALIMDVVLESLIAE